MSMETLPAMYRSISAYFPCKTSLKKRDVPSLPCLIPRRYIPWYSPWNPHEIALYRTTSSPLNHHIITNNPIKISIFAFHHLQKYKSTISKVSMFINMNKCWFSHLKPAFPTLFPRVFAEVLHSGGQPEGARLGLRWIWTGPGCGMCQNHGEPWSGFFGKFYRQKPMVNQR